MVRGLVIVASVLAFCGVSYMPFLPVLAKTQLHVGPQPLGIMYSVGGVGGLIGGLAIASMGRGAGRLQLMLVGGVVYAGSLFIVAHSAMLAITLPALVGISFAFVAVNTSMTTLLQTDTDPAMRGRLLGINATIFAGLQPLGTVAYGLIPHTQLFNAIGVGALLVGAATVIVVVTPSFRARVNAPSLAPGGHPGGPRYTGLRMFHRGRAGAVAAACAVVVTGCSSPAHSTGPAVVIARVASYQITLAQFNARYSSALTSIEQGGASANDPAQTTQLRATVLRSLIVDTVIREEATKLGPRGDPQSDPGRGRRRRSAGRREDRPRDRARGCGRFHHPAPG